MREKYYRIERMDRSGAYLGAPGAPPMLGASFGGYLSIVSHEGRLHSYDGHMVVSDAR